MKNKFLILVFVLPSILTSCVKSGKDNNIVDSSVATCTNGDLLMLSSFATRKDNSTFPVTSEEFTTFFSAPARAVATIKDELERNTTFSNNHSVIPSPLDDSDGRYGINLTEQDLTATGRLNIVPQKKHYLETIAVNDTTIEAIISRADIIACGGSGAIEARIADCSSINGRWAFYDGKKYGQDGEGNWKLVSVLNNGGTKYEVWRDERTKLLWSDKSSVDYSWFKAAGYSKVSALSLAETGYDASSDSIYQPVNPISVCPDVVEGEIAAGGGTVAYSYENPETDFKAGLSHPQVTWRLPSLNDWQLANVNGIRKVLPNMDNNFWSSTSYSGSRSKSWYFNGGLGSITNINRFNQSSVRCVASWRD